MTPHGKAKKISAHLLGSVEVHHDGHVVFFGVDAALLRELVGDT